MQFRLPLAVVTQSDVDRLLRELTSLEEFFIGAKVRAAGTPITPPRLSRQLDQISRGNSLNLLKSLHRQALIEQLKKLQKTAPSVHVSFASEPSAKFLEQILTWLRNNVHPYVMLRVGLQPSIAAGCVLRTPNKIFDMSLRHHLEKEQARLLELIKGAIK